MGKHGVSWENMENIERAENMEKMENINQITQNTLFMIQNICDLNTLFGNQMTLTLYFVVFMSTVEKS